MERITAKIVVLGAYFFIVKLGQKIEIHRKISSSHKCYSSIASDDQIIIFHFWPISLNDCLEFLKKKFDQVFFKSNFVMFCFFRNSSSMQLSLSFGYHSWSHFGFDLRHQFEFCGHSQFIIRYSFRLLLQWLQQAWLYILDRQSGKEH